ncbi:hypothetical protein Goshw_021617 [Gossypium schwendimanii]|uniref:Uncharacterized protein n=1 Tax=Gossypium schwendimanii TaxID=34291 RepID=A0A7J9KMM6_GOSSC|nr:hypothetical protein [Gossypium schwendimanii]
MNKPAGVFHWLKHSKDAQDVDWVVILDADMILREHPEVCNKVGGLLAMHIDDLRVLAPLWLSKTEEVHEDRAHWETNITGDIYGEGWISEMYGYAFGAAEPILLHYSLPFSVGNRSFSKLEHHEDGIVYDCRQLFPKPPYPREVKAMEPDPNKRRGLFLSIECINTMNEGLLLQHARHGCPMPKWSKYLSFLKSKTFVELTHPKLLTPRTVQTEAVGLMHSFHLSGQPENITSSQLCG